MINETQTEYSVKTYLASGPQKSAEANFRELTIYDLNGYNLSTVIVAELYDARYDSLFMLKSFFID